LARIFQKKEISLFDNVNFNGIISSATLKPWGRNWFRRVMEWRWKRAVAPGHANHGQKKLTANNTQYALAA